MAKPHNVSLYRSMRHLRKGGLHRALNVPEGETIPSEKLAVHDNDSTHLKHMKNFAKTMGKFKH